MQIFLHYMYISVALSLITNVKQRQRLMKYMPNNKNHFTGYYLFMGMLHVTKAHIALSNYYKKAHIALSPLGVNLHATPIS